MKQFKFVLISLLALLISRESFPSNPYLKNINGQVISLDSLKGKWVLFNYWASWCASCLDEIVELNHFYKNNKSQAALFAVNFDGLSLPEQIALIRKYKIDYPSLQFDPAPVLNLDEIRGIPVTFVFNPKGQLSATLYGEQTEKSLKRIIS